MQREKGGERGEDERLGKAERKRHTKEIGEKEAEKQKKRQNEQQDNISDKHKRVSAVI